MRVPRQYPLKATRTAPVDEETDTARGGGCPAPAIARPVAGRRRPWVGAGNVNVQGRKTRTAGAVVAWQAASHASSDPGWNCLSEVRPARHPYISCSTSGAVRKAP